MAVPTVVEKKYTLCHATGSASNPYVPIPLSPAGVVFGHLGDDHQDARDIIAPFEYEGKTYAQNWDATGQATFAAGCKVPEAPENSIDLVKDGPATSTVGATITYTFDVTNSGDQTLTDVHITDTLITAGTIAVTPSTLTPGGRAGRRRTTRSRPSTW